MASDPCYLTVLPRRLTKPASNRIDRYDCEYQQQSDHNYWNADEIQRGGIGETSIDLLVEPADDFEACSLELMRNRLIRADFAYRTPPNGSRRLALGHFKLLSRYRRKARRHRRSPAEAERRWRGEERAGRARCPLDNALLCWKRRSSGN